MNEQLTQTGTAVERARRAARLAVGERVVMVTVMADGRSVRSEHVIEAEVGEACRDGHAVMVGGGLWFDGLTGKLIGPLDAEVPYRGIRGTSRAWAWA